MRSQPGTTSLRAVFYMDEGLRLLPAHRQPAHEDADAHLVETGSGLRPGRGSGHAEPRRPGLQGACRTPAPGCLAGSRPSATSSACSRGSKKRSAMPAGAPIQPRGNGGDPGGTGQPRVSDEQRARRPTGRVPDAAICLSYLRGPRNAGQDPVADGPAQGGQTAALAVSWPPVLPAAALRRLAPRPAPRSSPPRPVSVSFPATPSRARASGSNTARQLGWHGQGCITSMPSGIDLWHECRSSSRP